MKIVREKTEILLMEYAAGTLDEACSLLVASYITLCPEARRYVGECEALGGALIERDCAPVAMSEGSLKAVLGKLCEDRSDDLSPFPSKFCRQQALPRPLAGHINTRHQRAKWRRFSPGMQFCALPVRDCDHSAMLVRLAPRAKAVRHTHTGTELTLVLEGGYQDEYGAYKAGDLVIADQDVTHQPVATNEGCLCITVTSGPPHFTGRIYSLLNAILR